MIRLSDDEDRGPRNEIKAEKHFCKYCGSKILKTEVVCPYCNQNLNEKQKPIEQISAVEEDSTINEDSTNDEVSQNSDEKL